MKPKSFASKSDNRDKVASAKQGYYCWCDHKSGDPAYADPDGGTEIRVVADVSSQQAVQELLDKKSFDGFVDSGTENGARCLTMQVTDNPPSPVTILVFVVAVFAIGLPFAGNLINKSLQKKH